MTAHEFARVVVPAAFSGSDRKAFEMPANILMELFDRGIALVWFLAQCFQQYEIQIAAQSLPQPDRRSFSRAADRAGRELPRVATSANAFRTPDGIAGPLRLLVSDGFCHLPGNVHIGTVRQTTRK